MDTDSATDAVDADSERRQIGSSPSHPAWRRWAPRLRVLATVGGVALLVPHIHVGDLFPEWTEGTVGWLLAALACTCLGIALSAVRWQRVTTAMELPAKMRTLLSAYLAGQFVSNFLPSTIGGDIVRVTRVSAATGESPATFASVVLDRMSGWLVLPLLCLAGLVINPTLFHLGRATRAAVGVSVVTLVLLGVLLIAAASPRVAGRLAGHTSWLRFLGAIHVGLRDLRRHPGVAASALGVGFAYQFVVIGVALLGARALHIGVGPTALLAFVPAVAIVQVLPLTIGGLGVREGAFVLFLTPLGVHTGQAIALGLLVYALHLIASLSGAPAFASGGRLRTARVPA